jgi:hypothetical protein
VAAGQLDREISFLEFEAQRSVNLTIGKLLAGQIDLIKIVLLKIQFVEGILTIKIIDKIYEMPTGSYIFIRRGTPHGQGNFTKNPIGLLTTFTPTDSIRYSGIAVNSSRA